VFEKSCGRHICGTIPHLHGRYADHELQLIICNRNLCCYVFVCAIVDIFGFGIMLSEIDTHKVPYRLVTYYP